MKLIVCHECSKEFDDDLQVCPHCGAPYGARGAHYPRVPGWMFMTILVLFLVLASIFAYSVIFM